MEPRNRQLLRNARMLRKNMTKEENRLWFDFLRDYPVRFRRQEIIGTYIADFYCASVKLIVELDGSQHYEKDSIENDTRRTSYFKELGLSVLRFSNLDIWHNFEGACLSISKAVNERLIK